MGVIQTLFPVVGGVGLLGFAIAFGNSLFLYIAGAMIVLMLGFSLAMRWSQRRGVRKRAAADARRYAAYLRERDDELAEAGELQRRALARLYPDPGKLWTAVLKRRGVWERRPDHPDFMHVRFGRGNVPLDRPVELELGVNPLTEYQSQPLQEARRLVERRGTLRSEPVVDDLSDVGVLAVTGERARTRGFARAPDDPARGVPRSARPAPRPPASTPADSARVGLGQVAAAPARRASQRRVAGRTCPSWPSRARRSSSTPCSRPSCDRGSSSFAAWRSPVSRAATCG